MDLKKFSMIQFKENNAKYFIYKTENNGTFEALNVNYNPREMNQPKIVKIKKLVSGKYGIMDVCNKKHITTDEIVAYIPTRNEFKDIVSTLNQYSRLKPLPAWIDETKRDVNFRRFFSNTGNPEEKQVDIYLRNML